MIEMESNNEGPTTSLEGKIEDTFNFTEILLGDCPVEAAIVWN